MFVAGDVPAQFNVSGVVEMETQEELTLAERKPAETEAVQLPWSQHCFLCGEGNPLGLQVRFKKDGDRVYTEYCVDKGREGYHGQVHGGIVAALLDETMGWAVALAIGRMCITAEVTIRYLKRLPIDTQIVVSARPGRWSRRLGHAEAEVRGVDGTLYARASGKFLPISLEQTLQVDSMLIYPEGADGLFDAQADDPDRREESD
jgi:uncharacterized protein (TIGR00369 family)